jgi:hypothetical protein
MTGQAPRKRHSAAVYRRRRIVLIVALIAIAGSIWLLIAQPWRGWSFEGGTQPVAESEATVDGASDIPVPGSTSSGSTPGATDAGGTPSASPSVTACLGSDITVEALTDKTSYGSGENPEFSIRLTNDGDNDCALNVGTSAQKFEVTSGSDTWWRSTDCQSEPSDMVVMLAVGQTVESAAPLEWDRTRSSTTTCDDESRSRASGGGATYYLSVSVAGIPSLEEAMFLLY